jgi:hypothetical protein
MARRRFPTAPIVRSSPASTPPRPRHPLQAPPWPPVPITKLAWLSCLHEYQPHGYHGSRSHPFRLVFFSLIFRVEKRFRHFFE